MKKCMSAMLILALTGCTSYRAATGLLPTVGPVRIVFAAPYDVVVRTSAGDSVLFTAVSAIQGTVLSTSTDSIRVQIAAMHGLWGKLEGVPTPSVAAIARDPSVSIQVRHPDPVKSVGAVLVLVAAAVGLAFFIVMEEAYGS